MQSLRLGDEGMLQGCKNTLETEQKNDCDSLVEPSRLAEQLDVKSSREGKPGDTKT